MDLKYAGSEVLQMAVEIEKKGKAFYESVAGSVKDAKAVDLFRFLAAEEVKHQHLFQDMLKEVETIHGPYDNTEVILYFKALVDRRIFPSDKEGELMDQHLNDLSVATKIAVSMEKDSILFYYELLPAIREKDHDIIHKIIEEERNHILRLTEFADTLK